MISRGKADARKLAHARVRQRFVEEGLAAALLPRPSPRVYARKLDGAQEARLVALACSEPPEGKTRWTLRLLAERMVELEVVPDLSHETVRQTLKKECARPSSYSTWKTCWRSITARMTRSGRWCA